MNTQRSRIALISFLVLSLELALIRLVPAEIKSISYFTNLLLFSSFFGLGLGCILSRWKSLASLIPIGAFLIYGFLVLSRGIVIYDTGKSVHYWLQGMDTRYVPILQLPLILAAIATFILSALPFIGLGQALAQNMDKEDRLSAYSWDIAGSLAGTLLFSLTSFFGVPPWLWITGILAIAGWTFARNWTERLSYFISGACFLFLAIAPHHWKWSPYYFIQYEPSQTNITIWVNSSFHQEAIQFDSPDTEYRKVADLIKAKFAAPYDAYRKYHSGANPKNVLILGAGSGNDANVALMNGAEHVTAVEIDPSILEIGRKYNSGKPYSNPAVRVVQDDGRHFLWNTREHYDLIVFGTLDSQTLLTGQSNLRLENYIYTQECFKDVRAALNDGGMVATYYSIYKPWLFKRIYPTMNEAFKGHLRLATFTDNYLFNAIVMGARGIENFVSDPRTEEALADGIPSTDDWPYIYLEHPTISSLYVKVFAFVGLLILAVLFLVFKMHGWEKGRGVFFLLGCGFTLMESAAIVRLALVFGTTWIVSAVVFTSALLTIYLSNLLVLKKKAPPLNAAWIGLVGFVAVNYVFPMDVFFSMALPLRILMAVVLVGGPVFCAGICFSRMFATQTRTGFALGINLVGAMAGGLFEYLSMLTGMRDIWLVVLVVYLFAYLQGRKLGVRAA